MSFLSSLPPIRGSYRENAPLHTTNWFGVGGVAQVLFKPADTQDLADFMRGCPADIPLTVIGVGSNLIIRDGGLDGVVIRLGRGFTGIAIAEKKGEEAQGADHEVRGGVGAAPCALHTNAKTAPPAENTSIEAGAAALDLHVARMAAEAGCAGLEFLSGIPGTIGGALAMNGGAYGAEVADCLIEAELVLCDGTITRMTPQELHYTYRHSVFPQGAVFTRAWFRTAPGDPEAIAARMEEIRASREASQPIRERTGGSTFKNPPGMKAWQLIDAAGCRGLRVGGAQMSELHCNFMINTGDATAADLESLGEEVRARVLAHSGVVLEWEIKRVGKAGTQ